MNLLANLSTIGGLVTYLLDGIIVITLIVAIISGCRHSYKKSLARLIVYLVSLVVALLVGWLVAIQVASNVSYRMNLSLFIPDRLSSVITVEPLVEIVVTAVIFTSVFLVVLALSKCILGVIAYHFNLIGKLFTKRRPNRLLDVALSVSFSLVTAYLRIMVMIAIFAFPLFNIVREGSLSAKFLNTAPFVSNKIEQVFEPFVVIQDFMNLVDSEIGNIMSGGNVNTNALAQEIIQNPEMVTQLIPLLPEEAVSQANEVLAGQGMTQTDAIHQFEEMVERGEITASEIQALLDAHLP